METGSKTIGLRAATGVLIGITIIVAVFASGITLPGFENKKGRLTVLLIDAPVELHQLNVTVTEVEVHKVGDGEEDGSWITIMDGEIEFNLLYLQDGRSLNLTSTEITVGSYNKIRMNVSEASASTVENPETPIPLNVPPNKIDVIINFEVSEGEGVIIIIDMQPNLPAISNKTNNFRPVLKASQVLEANQPGEG